VILLLFIIIIIFLFSVSFFFSRKIRDAPEQGSEVSRSETQAVFVPLDFRWHL